MLQLLAQIPDYNYNTEVTTSGEVPAGFVAAMGGFFLIFMLIMVVLGIFTIWMLIDSIIRKDEEYPNGSGKIMWILLILFIGFIPAIIYFFIVKKKIPRGTGGGQVPPQNPKPSQNNVPPTDNVSPPVQ